MVVKEGGKSAHNKLWKKEKLDRWMGNISEKKRER